MADSDDTTIVPIEEVRNFVVRCMMAIGTSVQHAADLAEVLVSGDQRGHYSHGINRLDMYVEDIQSGSTTTGEVVPRIIKESVSTANVDGMNLMGPTVGKFCIDLAIDKAKQTGIGWVSTRGSNHFGIAGWYSMRAASQGLIGMAFTNSSPITVPTRAKKAFCGTNPISVAAPAKNDMFVLDMATSCVSFGKVEICQRNEVPSPEGWGLDSDGKPSTNPDDIVFLSPLGGDEITGGYKGYGLGMMVELFCGILGGATWGPQVRKWRSVNTAANLGQCFVAINPEMFAPSFEERTKEMLDAARKQEPADGETEVLVAGDPERKHIAMCEQMGGIPYVRKQINHVDAVAKMCGVTPIKGTKSHV